MDYIEAQIFKKSLQKGLQKEMRGSKRLRISIENIHAHPKFSNEFFIRIDGGIGRSSVIEERTDRLRILLDSIVRKIKPYLYATKAQKFKGHYFTIREATARKKFRTEGTALQA